MHSVGYLKQFVSDKLAAAAEEIFAVFHSTIVEYEKELDRHRKLMELAWKPEVKLRRIDLPRPCIFNEELAVDKQSSLDQDRTSKVDQEELQLPVIKEQQEELSILEFTLKEEPEDLQLYSADGETNRSGDTVVDWNPEVSEHESGGNQVACVSNDCDFSSSGLSPKSVGIQTANKPCVSPGGSKSISELNLKQENEDFQLGSTNETSIKSEAPTVDWNPEEPSQECEVKEIPDLTTAVSAANVDLSRYPDVSKSQELAGSESKNSSSKRHKRKNMNNNVPKKQLDDDQDVTSPTPSTSLADNRRRNKLNHTANMPYSCQECGKNFSKSAQIKRHMITHTNRERPHACPTCGKSFLTRTHLKQHEAIHTGERTHVCQVCNKRFLLSKSLTDHMRIHRGERRHVCQTCNKRFLFRRDLVRHMRIHTVHREKPHVCQTCGKAFTQRSHLTQHMAVHRAKKRFSCKECGKWFPSSFSLTHHVASAHYDF